MFDKDSDNEVYPCGTPKPQYEVQPARVPQSVMTMNEAVNRFEELQKSMEVLVKTLCNKRSKEPLDDFERGQLHTAEYVLNFIKNY